MGIKVKLDMVMARRGITLTELSERVGVTLANLSILKTGKGKAMRFSTLEALCHELHCQPGDILEYEVKVFLNCVYIRHLAIICPLN